MYLLIDYDNDISTMWTVPLRYEEESIVSVTDTNDHCSSYQWLRCGVNGEGIDSVQLTNLLRKKVGFSKLMIYRCGPLYEEESIVSVTDTNDHSCSHQWLRCGVKDYTLKQYLVFTQKLQSKAKPLAGAEDDDDNGFDPSDVRVTKTSCDSNGLRHPYKLASCDSTKLS